MYKYKYKRTYRNSIFVLIMYSPGQDVKLYPSGVRLDTER